MESPTQNLIERHGDCSKFADAIGTDPNRVRQWKFRKRIPRSAWPEIVQAFPEITLDVLMELEGEVA